MSFLAQSNLFWLFHLFFSRKGWRRRGRCGDGWTERGAVKQVLLCHSYCSVCIVYVVLTPSFPQLLEYCVDFIPFWSMVSATFAVSSWLIAAIMYLLMIVASDCNSNIIIKELRFGEHLRINRWCFFYYSIKIRAPFMVHVLSVLYWLVGFRVHLEVLLPYRYLLSAYGLLVESDQQDTTAVSTDFDSVY